jgi:hypothetical protein
MGVQRGAREGCGILYGEGVSRSVWVMWGSLMVSGWARGAVGSVGGVQEVCWSARSRGEAASPFFIDGQSGC